ncbi:MAG: Rossmann-like domain-containing protein [Candidatus Hecatellaceae archaeon]
MPGRIVGEILAFLFKHASKAFQRKVSNVCIGLNYTGVQLDTGHLGLCATLPGELNIECCEIFDRAGSLAGNWLFDLVKLAGSWKPLEAVVGLAAVNAASQMFFGEKTGDYWVVWGNIVNELKVDRDDTVVMVGNIRPIAEALKAKAGMLYILERSPRLREAEPYHLPDTACEEYLPRASVAVITASTLVNGSIDRLLELTLKAREVAVVGPTTPLTPDVFFNHGVTLLGGVHVTRPEAALRVIMEGGGTRELKRACELVNIRPKKR